MINKKSKLYLSGRNAYIALIILIVLTFVFENLYGCDGSCDQNTFEGMGLLLIVLPAAGITLVVSVLSLVLFLVDRYRAKGSLGIYRRRGAYFILSIVLLYIVVLSTLTA